MMLIYGLVLILQMDFHVSPEDTVLTYSAYYDLNQDKNPVLFLFYDELGGEYDELQFTLLCIQVDQERHCVENQEDAWLKQEQLYDNATDSIDKRVGVVRHHDKIFFWLTGFEFGCCLNQTTIVEYTGNKLIPIFKKEFKVDRVQMIEDKLYMVGVNGLGTTFGANSSGFYYTDFNPELYFEISNSMFLDSLTTQLQAKAQMREFGDVDIFDSVVAHRSSDPTQKVLINRADMKVLSERDYPVLSLFLIDEEYLKDKDEMDLRLMRNELFAVNGYVFRDENLQRFYSGKSWYKPIEDSAETVYIKFSEIERLNSQLIRTVEAQKK